MVALRANFHCNHCKVAWNDTDTALCFVCDKPYRVNKHIHGINVSTCYHLNQTDEPFCPSCRTKIGKDDQHHRRTLRRMVGLR